MAVAGGQVGWVVPPAIPQPCISPTPQQQPGGRQVAVPAGLQQKQAAAAKGRWGFRVWHEGAPPLEQAQQRQRQPHLMQGSGALGICIGNICPLVHKLPAPRPVP